MQDFKHEWSDREAMRLAEYDCKSPEELFAYQRSRYEHVRLLGMSKFVSDTVIYTVPELASSGSSVLVVGETGTGKELIVSEVVRLAGIPSDRFRTVNCAEFGRELLASELFGHVKGSFTGATSDKTGLVQVVEGGALFLDELGAMRKSLQAQFLRVMQQREYRRVGDTQIRSLEGLRVFAATNDASRLREDLQWRFQEHVHVPPLRERLSDVFVILHGILDQKRGRDGIPEDAEWGISPVTLVCMVFSPWLGNVRELVNAEEVSIERWRLDSGKTRRIAFLHCPPRLRYDLCRDGWAIGRLWEDLVDELRNPRVCRSVVRRRFPAKRLDSLEAFVGVSRHLGMAYHEDNVRLPQKLAWGSPLEDEWFLTCAEALDFLRVAASNRVDRTAPEDFKERMRPYERLAGALSLLDRVAPFLFRLPSDVARFYNQDGSRKQEAGDDRPDLTGLTEQELLQEYYRQLWTAKRGVQKDIAEAADIGKNAVARRLKAAGLKKDSQSRSGDPESPDGD